MKVLWDRRDADALLRELTGGVPTRLCPTCGSIGHGRPRVGELFASIARAEGMSLVVVDDQPVGVDLEASTAQAPAEVALHPDEADQGPLPVWVRKEALLKATGAGLGVAPGSFRIVDGRPVGLVGAGDLIVTDLEIPGFVAALAHTLVIG